MLGDTGIALPKRIKDVLTLLQRKKKDETVWGCKKACFKQNVNPVKKNSLYLLLYIIHYSFLANIEHWLKLSGYIYQKNFDFIQTWRYNTKLHWTDLFWVELALMIWRCHGIRVFILKQMVRENHCMRTTSVTFMVIFWRFHSERTWQHLCSKSFINNHETHWQWHIKYFTNLYQYMR